MSKVTLRLRHLLVVAVVLLLLTPLVAFAGGDRNYVVVARHLHWDIVRFADGTCYASAAFQYDQFIRIGINGPNDYYVMLNSPNVNNMTPANNWPIYAQFDNGQKYEGKGTVHDIGPNRETRIIEFPIGGSMMGSFMESMNMYIHARTNEKGYQLIATMNLRGTYQAMLMVAECTGQNYRRRQNDNPFYNT